jgi:thiol-disulfide isomerase/thioredoxin
MIILLAARAVTKIRAVTAESAIVELNRKGKLPMLVKFWSPWCAQCALVAPVFQAISDLPNFTAQVLFASFDCHEHSAFCSENRMTFPSFVFIANNLTDSIAYGGPETPESLAVFLERQLHRSLVKLPPGTDPASLVSNFASVFVFESPRGDDAVAGMASKLSATFKFTETKFYHRPARVRSLAVYRSPKMQIGFERNWTEREIFDFVIDHCLPFVVAFSPMAVRHIVHLRKFCALAVIASEGDRDKLFEWNLVRYPDIQYTYATFQTAAKSLQQIGMKGQKSSFFVVVNFTRKVWWKRTGPFTADEFNQLVELARSDTSRRLAAGPGSAGATVAEKVRFRMAAATGVDPSALVRIASIGAILGAIIIGVWACSRKKLKSD